MTSNQDDLSGGTHFEESVQIQGDLITNSAITKTTVYEDNRTYNYEISDGNLFTQIGKLEFWIGGLQRWNESIFRWSKAPEYARSSWAGMVLHAFSNIDRVEPKLIFQGLATLGLWFLMVWLVAPMLAWPHTDRDLLFDNVISYGIATWLIPLLVSLFTVPDQIEERHVKTHQKQWELYLLKFTGALVGFWTLSAIIIISALIAYYMGIPFSSSIVRNGVILIPLLFSYIAARTMPAGRLEMFNDKFKLHSADHFFCITFLFMGPATSLFLYSTSEILNDRFQGLLMLMAAGLSISFWEYRKKASSEIHDSLAISFLGIIIPLCIVFFAVIRSYSDRLSLIQSFYLGIFIIYLLSETILMATLLIRKQIRLVGRGQMGLLLFVLLINIILIINAWLYGTNLWPTVIVITTIVMIWHFWGQKRFGHHLWIHPSFWIMQASLGMSGYLLVQGWLALWLNGLLTLSVAAALIRWAYRRPISECDVELPVTEGR